MRYLIILLMVMLPVQSQGGVITLSWHINSDNECGFIIERSDNSEPFKVIAYTNAGVSLYKDTVLNAVIYKYKVKAFNNVGHSGYSNEASGVTSGPDPIPEEYPAVPLAVIAPCLNSTIK